MENNSAEINRTRNKIIKEVQQSNALAFQPEILGSSISESFDVLGRAFEGTAQKFAEVQLALNNGSSKDPKADSKIVSQLQNAPKKAISFMENLVGELSTVEDRNFDINNNAEYSILNAMITKKPGFSPKQGFALDMNLNEDGTQELIANGPGLREGGLKINSGTLESLTEAGQSIVAQTPEIEKDMESLLAESQLFDVSMVGKDGKLTGDASINEEFILKGPEGKPVYEEIELGEGKARNVLQYDEEKLAAKLKPFIDAEIAGIIEMGEEGVIAAWNTVILPNATQSDEMETSKTISAGDDSWLYERDLPLSPDKKELFAEKYKQHFLRDYLYKFTKNQLPTIEEDREIFNIKVDMKNDAKLNTLLKKYGL